MNPTARQVVEHILADLSVEPMEETVDTFKAGDPDAPVAGIATTFMATLDVLERAADKGVDLVITHEPTFYDHQDETDWLEGDPVVAAKRCCIDENGLVVWRFHDHWHRHEPDGILAGMARQLGWEEFQDGECPWRFDLPPTTLAELLATVQERIGATVVRAVGDPALACSGVALVPGAAPRRRHLEALQADGVDALVIGEAREWETCEYVRDAARAGLKKGLVLAGHCRSEEAGMEFLAEWLRPRFEGVRIDYLPAGDPFWTT